VGSNSIEQEARVPFSCVMIIVHSVRKGYRTQLIVISGTAHKNMLFLCVHVSFTRIASIVQLSPEARRVVTMTRSTLAVFITLVHIISPPLYALSTYGSGGSIVVQNIPVNRLPALPARSINQAVMSRAEITTMAYKHQLN
jgi:hypothetical protein